MKNLLLILCFTFLSTSIFCQNLPAATKWKIKKISISGGVEQDMIKGMDGNYLIRTGKNVSATIPSGLTLQSEDWYGGVCENPHFRLAVALEVPNTRNVELQLGVNAFFNRLDGAYYSNGRTYESELGYFDQNYFSVESMAHEVGLEGALVKRFSLGNFLNLYGGAGTNLGYSFAGDLWINGNTLESVDQNMSRSVSDIVAGNTFQEDTYFFFEQKDAFHQRFFLQAGVGFLFFKKFELGIEYRGGLGYKANFDGPVKGTQLKSIGLNTKWVL